MLATGVVVRLALGEPVTPGPVLVVGALCVRIRPAASPAPPRMTTSRAASKATRALLRPPPEAALPGTAGGGAGNLGVAKAGVATGEGGAGKMGAGKVIGGASDTNCGNPASAC